MALARGRFPVHRNSCVPVATGWLGFLVLSDSSPTSDVLSRLFSLLSSVESLILVSSVSFPTAASVGTGIAKRVMSSRKVHDSQPNPPEVDTCK